MDVTDGRLNIICPYCFYVFDNSERYMRKNREHVSCEKCGKVFFLLVSGQLTYSTKKR
jgi:uncharacterized Zn-finger protein